MSDPSGECLPVIQRRSEPYDLTAGVSRQSHTFF